MLGNTAHLRHLPCYSCRTLSPLNRSIAFTALAVVCGLLPALATRAIVVNEISPGFPTVNDTVGNFAVNYTFNSSATAGFPPDNVTNTYGTSETFYPTRDQVIQDPALTIPASVLTNFHHAAAASATESGHIGKGTIGGRVDVSVTAGTASASTTLTLTYIDKIHMSSDSDLLITPTVTGVGQRVFNPIDSTEFAVTSAELDTYFFTATNPPPTAGTAFPAAYYARTDVNYLGQTLSIQQNQLNFPAGSDWYLALEFTLRGGANITYPTDSPTYAGDMFTATGDFSHTAFATLDDPNNSPFPVYTSASGIDYTTAALVPEPTSFALAAITTAALLRRRPRKA